MLAPISAKHRPQLYASVGNIPAITRSTPPTQKSKSVTTQSEELNA
jgi:hypothetical protein